MKTSSIVRNLGFALCVAGIVSVVLLAWQVELFATGKISSTDGFLWCFNIGCLFLPLIGAQLFLKASDLQKRGK
jgi:uncharacterized membrane protein YhdT